MFAALRGCLPLRNKTVWTQATAGSGSSNGVNYSYTLETCSLSGRYFLDSGAKEFVTDPFAIAGSRWQLIVENANGQIGLQLKSNNEENVNICFEFQLINYANPSMSVLQGDRKGFERGAVWGIDNLMSTFNVARPDAGYIQGGCFLLVATIGRLFPENETLATNARGKPSSVNWQLRHVRELGDVGVFSEKIEIANMTWFLHLNMRRSESKWKEDSCGLYLRCTAEVPVEARFRFILVNHDDEKQNITKEWTCKFSERTPSWGSQEFIRTRILHDPTCGFVRDGWINIIAHIWIDESAKRRETTTLKNERTGEKRVD